MSEESYLYGSSSSRQKSRIDLTVNQTLYRRSSLDLTAGETIIGIARQQPSRAVRLQQWHQARELQPGGFVPRRRGRSGAPIPSSRASVSIPLGGKARSSQVYADAVSSQHGDSNTGISGYLKKPMLNPAHRPTTARTAATLAASAWASKAVVRQLQPGRDNKQNNLGASASAGLHVGEHEHSHGRRCEPKSSRRGRRRQPPEPPPGRTFPPPAGRRSLPGCTTTEPLAPRLICLLSRPWL